MKLTVAIMGRISNFVSLAFGAAAVTAQSDGNWTVGQVVDTSSGSVTGHAASVNTEVSEYLGIPFAIPPVGDLRWTAPQAFNGTGAINGTDFVSLSPQFSFPFTQEARLNCTPS